MWHTKPQVPQVQKLLSKMGYRVREVILMRAL
jgi:hypothetical protein